MRPDRGRVAFEGGGFPLSPTVAEIDFQEGVEPDLWIVRQGVCFAGIEPGAGQSARGITGQIAGFAQNLAHHITRLTALDEPSFYAVAMTETKFWNRIIPSDAVDLSGLGCRLPLGSRRGIEGGHGGHLTVQVSHAEPGAIPRMRGVAVQCRRSGAALAGTLTNYVARSNPWMKSRLPCLSPFGSEVPHT